ncbi:General transcriptional co-repressor [Komagataella phaffii CBS 7435]|uniref:General repressor of transcription, forms complex with Cyc8p n=2 Tax=Komagataella phaffii TaxID=460519 RepID=C4R677_KOMPG|nr:General repressor of transcription, forms complex with Cyc8p [Komagataella phaffii GS115]AOA63270.1 GQ67_04131T0 [Komagataella phaffii]CAH2449099.1 General transcriptional co-repressor [Komagataella phaffii CBS 7435]AOA69263.1 GQ68_04104T0 [Komagataella phaffii GS115]CAY71063.1 General repressor of transcription, forms complex with Cyc8p [Komagataella phaffii GS115]CCA39141.1 General transcriptional co-repressor [Komagataella phaffii CBS 7435]
MSYNRPLPNTTSVANQQSRQRLEDLLQGIKKEFENLSSETSFYKLHQDEVEMKFTQQNRELQNIRNAVYELDVAHRKMKDAYEKEILRYKQELEKRDRLLQQQQQQQHQPQHQQPGLENRDSSAYNQQLPPPNLNAHQSGKLLPAQGGEQNFASSGSLPPLVAGSGTNANASKPETSPSQAPAPSFSAPPRQEPTAIAKTSPTVSSVPASAPEEQESKSTNNQEIKNLRAQHNKFLPSFLKDLDTYSVLPYKKQHAEYYVLYNPDLPKEIEVEMVHSLDHSSVVCCVRFSNDGKFLATGCNKLTQVFDVQTGELVARLSDDSSANANGTYDTDTGDLYIRSVCFSPDGKYLATGAEDKLIRIWDLSTRSIVKVLRGHEQDIYSLDFFPDGTRLVSGSGDRSVRIWNLVSSQCALTLSIEDGVTTVAVSPDGKLIAAGSLDRAVRVWDAEGGFLVERLDSENVGGNGHKDSVYSVTFTHDGKGIASGSLDSTVKLWSLDVNKTSSSKTKSSCEVTYVGHRDFVLSVCVTPDDKYILSGSKDRGVMIWHKETGDPLLMLQGHRNSVISVSVNQELEGKGGYFATGSGDCKARIWKWT